MKYHFNTSGVGEWRSLKGNSYNLPNITSKHKSILIYKLIGYKIFEFENF